MEPQKGPLSLLLQSVNFLGFETRNPLILASSPPKVCFWVVPIPKS